MKSSHNHQLWMAKAIQLARRGWYSTHPNPRVGCVIVKDNRLLAEGFHAVPGQAHAEINALRALNGNAEGATVYVTLEPCAHTGKTPPCTEALIKARPETVVIAMQDPNPLVCGKGISQLQSAGIEVVVGILEHQARELNPGFIKRITEGVPFVRLKMASSLDGRTALANGLSQWITSEEARRDVQLLRASSAAVLSTAQTVINDNASLNVRLSSDQLGQSTPVRQPVRVILDADMRLTGDERLFDLAGEIWLITSNNTAAEYPFQLPASCRVFAIDCLASDELDLHQLMQLLAQNEINEVHTECGGTLAGALLKQGLVDQMVFYMAPSILGNASRGLLDVGEISIMSDQIRLQFEDIRRVGDDLKITAVRSK